MEQSIHELTAAYALDALDGDERRRFEEHLQECARCRDEVVELTGAAALLAFGAEPAEPPARLRERIVEGARAERGARVVPLPLRRPRLVLGAAAGTAAAAVAAAVVLAVWASSLSGELDRSRAAVAVLAAADARSIPLSGADGLLVVEPGGRAALVLGGLRPAPAGKTYEIWVIRGGDPVPAGLFEGDVEREVVLVDEAVEPGAVVAVTLEDEGGAEAPTSEPLFTAAA